MWFLGLSIRKAFLKHSWKLYGIQQPCGKLCGNCGKRGDDDVLKVLYNGLSSCYLSEQAITLSIICQDPPPKCQENPKKSVWGYTYKRHFRCVSLDTLHHFDYNSKAISGGIPMSIYAQSQKTKYRITLELDVFNDFDPHQVDWEKLFELGGNESAHAYIENLSADPTW